MLAYVNGQLVPQEEAKISVFDRGLLLGDAIFDTLRTYGGKTHKLGAHTERLRRSLRYVEMDPAVAEQVVDVLPAVGRPHLGDETDAALLRAVQDDLVEA